MDILAEALVGFLAGLLGGLLGVGGSVLIIPGLIFYLSQLPGGYQGSQQHLIQGAAMICNVFVAAPSLLAHYRAGAILPAVLRWLVPGALAGMLLGVALSNSWLFAQHRGAYLALVLAFFLGWEGISHLSRYLGKDLPESETGPPAAISPLISFAVGCAIGAVGGLLGIGGGTLSIPLQCRVLRLPLRNAIANSAGTIVVVSSFGALYKNVSLPIHGFTPLESLRLAAMIVPTAIVGSYLGGRLTHSLPRRALELVLVCFFLGMAFLTGERAISALDRHSNEGAAWRAQETFAPEWEGDPEGFTVDMIPKIAAESFRQADHQIFSPWERQAQIVAGPQKRQFPR